MQELTYSRCGGCFVPKSVTENLKSVNQMEWVRAMNNIRNRAEEIVKSELIYN